MKKFTLIVAALMTICSGALFAADLPEFYLRGHQNGWLIDGSGNFAPNESYHFTHDDEGNYSLTLTRLAGQFKISNDNWSINFGWDYKDSEYVENNSYVIMQSSQTGTDGGNWNCNELTNVTFKFKYVKGQNSVLVVGAPAGQMPDPNPVIPDDDPVSFLSGTLPVLYINVYTDENMTEFDNEVISKDLDHKNYFSNANYWLDCSACDWMKGAKDVGSAEEPLPLEIKARGNWTRKGFSKKPFKLKLGKKQGLLGLTKSKHFAILAHADDGYGYLRNFVGFNLGRRIGLPWTPDQQPIEVVINGDYRGLYFLTESIRIGDDRIMIQELADNETQPELCSGGYLVELDNYDEADENQIRMLEETCVNESYQDMLRITFDTPEFYSDLQRQFVGDQFSTMNHLIGTNSDMTWSYLDLDDAVRYYIVEEIISHCESYHGSTYLFRDRGAGQKWHFSPLWDCGNAFNAPTNMFFYQRGATAFGNTWIPSMRANEMFNDKLEETWKWFMSNKYDGIEDDIREVVEHLKAGAEADYARWHGQPTPVNGQSVADNRDMDNKREQVLWKLRDKVNWLKDQFGDYTQGEFAEPTRDKTPAAELPYYIPDIASVVDSNIIESDDEIEYFDMFGMRVSKPAHGSVVIERRGTQTRKLIVR